MAKNENGLSTCAERGQPPWHPSEGMLQSSCQKTCSKYNLINVLRVSQLLSRSCTAGFSSIQRLSSSTLFALTDCGQCNRSGSAGARIDVLCGSEHSSAYIALEFVQLVIICHMSRQTIRTMSQNRQLHKGSTEEASLHIVRQRL